MSASAPQRWLASYPHLPWLSSLIACSVLWAPGRSSCSDSGIQFMAVGFQLPWQLQCKAQRTFLAVWPVAYQLPSAPQCLWILGVKRRSNLMQTMHFIQLGKFLTVGVYWLLSRVRKDPFSVTGGCACLINCFFMLVMERDIQPLGFSSSPGTASLNVWFLPNEPPDA